MSTPTVEANDGVGLPEITPGDARQRILDATVECFRAYGYEKSSMRLIANTAKCPRRCCTTTSKPRKSSSTPPSTMWRRNYSPRLRPN